MQLVQGSGSGDKPAQKPEISVTKIDVSKQKDISGNRLNRISERQQQLLLSLVGLGWMGLLVATLTFIAEPAQTAPAAAKAAPALATNPAAYAPQVHKPDVKAVKI